MSLRSVVVVALLLWFPVGALAQSPTTGAIQGVVTDSKSGDALAGVTVIITASGVSTQSQITDSRGAYKIANLPPGRYLVTFYYLDSTIERSDIIVGIQKVTPVYLKMGADGGGKGEVVRIEGHAPTIDPTSTAQGITIDKDYLKNIPVPGRTFESALGAAPGSQGDVLGVAFSGSTSLENQYIVDGVNTTGLTFGTVGSPVINDFIEEIEIITGGYNAEFGRATGGIVNVVTKSGSNELKGSIFGYMQPGFLTAPAVETPSNSSSIDVVGDVGYRADLGFEIGGPIKKDKLWFYVGFAPAFTRIDYTRTTKTQTDCRRTLEDGTRSDCDTRLVTQGGFADGTADIDPDTGFFITDDVDSEVRATTLRTYNTLAKLNYALNPQQQGQLAVSYVPGSSRRPGLFGPASYGRKSSGANTDVSLKWTSKFNNDRTEVEATLGLHRDSFTLEAIDDTLQGTPQQILIGGELGTYGRGFGESQATQAGCTDGMTGGDRFPFITNCPMDSSAYIIGGPGSVYQDLEQRRTGRISVTQRVKAAGTHEFKAGIDSEDNRSTNTRALSGDAFLYNQVNLAVDVLRWVQIAGTEDGRERFDQMCTTANPDAEVGGMLQFKCDFLGNLGAEGTGVVSNTFNWSAYVRDSWQIRPNITVNAGMRYEEQRLRYAGFLQGQVDPVTGETFGKNALVLKNEWAPRLGILYDWTKEGRSKVYAHWGRFYESIPLAINNLTFGQPIIYSQTYTPTLCGEVDPAIGAPNGFGCSTTATEPDQGTQLSGVNGSLVAPGLKGQYIDEIVAGAEYEFFDDFKLGLSIQDRRYGRVIEDVSVDGANTYIVANPGDFPKDEEAKLQRRIDAMEAGADRDLLEKQLEMFRGIRIFDKPRRDYTAMQITMSRRFKNKLYTQASYTFSRTRGNYPGLISYDDNVILPNASTQYDLIELLANRIGPLPQDRPHYVKLDGYYTHDKGKIGAFTVGARFRALSGIPQNALGSHYLYGDSQSFLLPRGTIGRSSFEHGLDLHVGYARPLKRQMKFEVFFDIYNVYDNQGTFNVDDSYANGVRQSQPNGGGGSLQNANPVSGGTYDDLLWVKTVNDDGGETNVPIGRNPNFRKTIGRYGPAYGRIGARLTF
ncbi:MAG: carboxypeptidase regulatory-like domain-containing protein [Deltaproteobacteria bacterium]|nr:carboxypeptidase regulatory-like domain-containing protein [Deltaproteobacteria bacterium]